MPSYFCTVKAKYDENVYQKDIESQGNSAFSRRIAIPSDDHDSISQRISREGTENPLDCRNFSWLKDERKKEAVGSLLLERYLINATEL